jgi:uncharacterized protein YeaO (DUF488 family)
MAVRLKRAYDQAEPGDGFRVLVDRLWPRGVRKDALPLDAWYRDLAPSTPLRRWFGHDPIRWDEFRRRYREELSRGQAAELLDELRVRASAGTLTLVFAARDADHSNAAALAELIDSPQSAGHQRSS